MKKTVIIFLILVLISSALSAEDTGGSTTGTSTTNTVAALSLLIPGDTLTLKFAKDANGTAIDATSKLFTLNKYAPFADTDIGKPSPSKEKYVTSAVTFYVVYQALVNQNANIVINVPSSFQCTTDSDTIPVQSDEGKINAGNATILKSGKNEIVSLDETKIYNGTVKCILALDVTTAKSGKTYTGTITMNVVAGS